MTVFLTITVLLIATWTNSKFLISYSDDVRVASSWRWELGSKFILDQHKYNFTAVCRIEVASGSETSSRRKRWPPALLENTGYGTQHCTLSNKNFTQINIYFAFIYSGLNDSGLDLANDMANDIDVAEAANLISAVRPRIVTPSRPTVGMKRPRSHASTPTANKCPRKQRDPDCSQCRHLLAENSELREANALLTEQLTQCRLESGNVIQQSEAPRPGKVPKAIAKKHQV